MQKGNLCEEFKEPSARGEKEHETFHLNFPCDFIPLIQYWILNCGMSLTSEFTIILKPHSFILPTYLPSTIMVSARAMECMERNNLEVYHPKLSKETRPTFLISWSESLCSSDLLFLHSPNIVLWPKIELHSCKIQLLVCWFAKLDW